MPQRKCAAKRLRVDKTKALANKKAKSNLKKELKNFHSLIQQGKMDEAKEKIKVVFSKLDRAATKGLLHKNTVARQKSSLSLKINPVKK